MSTTFTTTIRLAALAVILAAALVTGLFAGGAISGRDGSAAVDRPGMTHGNLNRANVATTSEFVDYGLRHLKARASDASDYPDYGVRHAAPAPSPAPHVPTQTLR